MIMQTREERHRKILDLVENQEIGTQTDLEKALKRIGVRVTQATLSRDIRELGLVKIASGGRYRYASRQNIEPSTTTKPAMHASLASVKRFVRNIDWSGNTVVIITDSGAASHVAEAIDRLELSQLLGTVAGDNTILMVVKRDVTAKKVVKDLESLLG
jgi:transcriptional regulator of arginine metabolism